MYHEKLIGFYESCSLETLQNAIATLEHWRVLERFSEPHPRRKHKRGPVMVRLLLSCVTLVRIMTKCLTKLRRPCADSLDAAV